MVQEKVAMAMENHGNVVSTSAVDHSEEAVNKEDEASDVVHAAVKTVVME